MTLITDSTVYLIIALVSLVTLSVFVASLFGSSFVDDAPCSALSYMTAIQRNLAGITLWTPPPSGDDRNELCPATRIRISERASEESVISTIAQQMAVCHRDYGAGDLDLFAHEPSQKTLYCVVCSHIVFPEGSSGVIEGLSEYLSTANVPGKDFTYAAYLGSVDHELYGPAFVPQYDIDTSQDYGILYFYGERNKFWANHVESVTTGATIGAGVAVVATVVAIKLAPVTAGVSLVLSAILVPVAGVGGGVVGGAAGAGADVGSEYIGATVLIPWDSDVFANALKCDRIEGLS